MPHLFKNRLSRLFTILLLIIPLASALQGCASEDSMPAGMPDMPEEILSASATVREAYQFAFNNPDALKNVPCYCGCGAMGHDSNYACYFRTDSSGNLEYDLHAVGCSICVEIALDVKKLQLQGKTAQEIRAAIDLTYAQFGPSNMPANQ